MKKSKSDASRSGLRASGLLSLLALIAVVALIIATTQVLRQQATDSRKAQLALAELNHNLDEQHNFQSQAFENPTLSKTLVAQSNALNAKIFAAVNELKARHVRTSNVERIRRSVAAYQQALNSSFSFLQAGNTQAALALDEKVTKPAYNSLNHTIDAEAETLGKTADKNDRTTTIGTLATLVLGAMMCMLIFGQQSRSRRAQDQQRTLRESEERFRSLLHNSSDVIVVTDDSGVVTYVTPPTRQLIISSDVDVVGTELAEYFHADDRVAVRRLLGDLSTHKQGRRYDWRVCRNDGSWGEVECLINDLTEETNIRGVVFTFHDVSERKRLEVELRQSHKLEAVGRLAGGMAHEINTPIQFVSDNVHFLSDAFITLSDSVSAYRDAAENSCDADAFASAIANANALSDIDFLINEVPVAMNDARNGLERVATIVRSMKAFGHPDRAEQEPANINEALTNTITVAGSELRGVAEVTTHFEELPPVICFLGELNQVWLNLMVNSAHAIAEKQDGVGTITVKTHLDGDHVVVEIEDSGGGIPDEISERVFDPFFSTKEVGVGTGQGLALARTTIVERHQGTLHFASTKGVGTMFTVRLPINGAQHNSPALPEG